MRYNLLFALTVTIAAIPFCQTFAQSTISNSPLDITASAGGWAAALPDYELGTSSSGGAAFSDSQDQLGGMVRLDAVRRALGTRTSFEANIFYASAESNNNSAAGDIDFANPANGANIAITGANPRLTSDVEHFGGDLIIRDTWQTRVGGLSAGIAYSLMEFEQEFELRDGAINLFNEDLDTHFKGAKIVSGWDGYLWNRASTFDLNVGIYSMNADYSATSGTVPASFADDLSKTTYTIETAFTTWTEIRGVDVGWTFGVTYFADMPTIDHRAGSAAKLSTDSAVTGTFMVELLLL